MMAHNRIAAGITAVSLALLTVTATTSSATDPAPPPTIGVEQQPAVQADTNTIIVTFDRAQTDPAQAARDVVEQAADTVAGAGITKVTPITEKTVSVTLDSAVTSAQTAKIGNQVEAEDGVRAAEPAAAFTTGSTNDTYYKYLWNVAPGLGSSYSANAEAAWPITTGGGVVVGVIDSGIRAHTDLTGSSTSIVGGNFISGYDFVSNLAAAGDGDGRDPNPTDPGDYCDGEDSSWHGTHVAGIIGAIRNNSKGIVGVAPGVKVQSLRALGRCGGSEADILTAIRWGAGQTIEGMTAINPTPAKVLNLSLGGDRPCTVATQDAINSVVAAGVTVVVAAGNQGLPVARSMPANCDNVISVGASGPTGARAGYSNYGTDALPLDIMAPGGSSSCSTTITACIVSTWNTGHTSGGTEGYIGMAGTSMAAPHVAAAAAMVKAVSPSFTPAQVEAALTGAATAAPGCTTIVCGAGILNVGKAVASRTVNAMSVPVVTGTAKVGVTLSTAGKGATGATYTYRWLRNGTAITGATSSSRTLTSADLGATLSVTVTASVQGMVASKSSIATAPVAAGTLTKTKSPYTSGTYRYGRTISARVGSWSPSGNTYRYQWLKNGVTIPGATASSYKLPKSMKGRYISVKVTVSRAGYTTTAATSSRHKVY